MALGVGAKGAVPQLRYDVFLSFRGEDTRKSFTSQLHAKLQQKRLASFIDNEKLYRGEVISQGLLQDIEGSLVSVVNELQKIVELRKEFGKAIFPVFYGVDPSDVRHQRGNFEKDFAKHEEVFKGNTEKVRRWRDALTDVANTSGWDSREYGREEELIESIVEAVWVNLRPKVPSTIGMLYGVDSKMIWISK